MMAPMCEKSQPEGSTRRVERRQDERREHVRFPFTAAVEAVEPQSDIKLRGRTADISSGGCYVDTISPFILGTTIKIRLTKGGVVFEAEATVVLSQVGMGMGIAFRSAAPNQIRNLRQWLNELEGPGNLSGRKSAPWQVILAAILHGMTWNTYFAIFFLGVTTGG
jgi:PilZ domain